MNEKRKPRTAKQRSDAAKRAAQRRLAKKIVRQFQRFSEYRRRVYVATCGGFAWQCYGPANEILHGRPDDDEPNRDFTLDDVIEDVVSEMKRNIELEDLVYKDHNIADDLAVYRDGHILALVRPGADGRPEVTRFDFSGPANADTSAP